jgi:glycosyltransferase involved in cell wall biosynthesis
MKFNILLFWFAGNWGEGRTYQKVSEHLSEIPKIQKVVCTFPPNRVKEDTWAKPLEIKKIGSKLILLKQNVPAVPLSSPPYRLRAWINRLAKERVMLTYLRMCGFKKDNTLLWLFPPHPYLEELITMIPHRLLVAHIVDNFTNLREDRWLHDQATVQYPKLKRDADVIITGSDFNHQLFSADRQRCYLFENAADEAFISKPTSLSDNGRKSPTLGYVGTVSQRTDLDLIKYVARQRPEWLILIAGREELSLKEHGLMGLPNVKYMGIIPYPELPKFLGGLDVCLIPHRNTDYCKSMSPLKLYQYLASGKPVVSTRVEGLGKLEEHLLVGDSYESFVQLIEQALKEDTLEMSQRRIDSVRGETWDRRVDDMFAAVEKCVMEKQLS